MSRPQLIAVCAGRSEPVDRTVRDPMGTELTENGLRAVFMARRPPLERFLKARGAGADAEDILQDMWLKLQSLDHGPIGEPMSYLYRMAENQLRDRYREARRREEREAVWGESAEHAAAHAEQRLIAKEGLQTVQETLGALGERTYAILYRYRIDGRSQKDIASELGVSLSLVEKHLQRAYRALLALKQGLSAGEDVSTDGFVSGGGDDV